MDKAVTQSSNDPISLDTKKVSSNKRKTQKEKTLEAFLLAGESGFYQITAYKTFQTTCLHTVVSNFQNEGIMFARKTIMHLNSDGGKTAFSLYWLADDEAILRAVDSLNHLRQKRGLPPYLGGNPYLIDSLIA
ncbi:hypothetical protein [Flavobacterium sp. W21_SRS_FM6]|uniref:hypothetical protein n=1 Tax=Flavobacterium sp. W21_SRS_FM6 TaxID=3240268 RepID=UPI003F93BC12